MESLFVRVLTLSLTGSAVLLPLLLLAPRLRGRYAAGTLSVLWLVLAPADGPARPAFPAVDGGDGGCVRPSRL